jgi:hypothetical protein
MTIAWHLRGYDRRSDLLAAEYDIKQELLPIMRDLLPEPENDPGMIDPYELTRDQTVRLADAIGLSIHPDRFDYFVEADEDWRMVEAKRESIDVFA